MINKEYIFAAIKIQTYYIFLPLLFLLFLQAGVILMADRYVDIFVIPLDIILLVLVFLAGLKTGMMIPTGTYYYYSVGMMFTLLYFLFVLFATSTHVPESPSLVFQDILGALALAICVGFTGCLFGKGIVKLRSGRDGL